MTDAKNNLLLFFQRPTEPCFMQKGDEKAAFQIPDDYYPDKYKAVSTTLASRFGNEASRKIPVKSISLPSLDFPMELPYNDNFSLFLPKHRQMAGYLIDVFMGMRDLEDLQSFCAYCQLRINPHMFNYCLSVALIHRPDTKGLTLPTVSQTFPDKFLDSKFLRTAREATRTVTDGPRMPIIIPMNLTASDSEPEQRVAYFREDIGINLHHWHWHLVYPTDSANRAIVAKDRRGELLYYMHQQIIARYNVERFCNNLSQVEPFGSDLRAPIAEAYFPKLNSQVASRTWPPRYANSVLQDLERPVDLIKMDIFDMEMWRLRILEAIDSNSILMPNGNRVALTEETGIDVLGDLMESSLLSPNRSYYGDFHNLGHIFMSYAHDPDHRHLELFGVMGDPATTMRDPLFYRWHRYVDDIFVLYKNKLPPYGNDKLEFAGIRLSSVSVEGTAGQNTFGTQWQQSQITVDNTTGQPATGTVRIFMAPIADDTGRTFDFNEQRKLMIELDKFSQELTTGQNVIRRKSADSSVTIPFERTFMDQTARVGDAGSETAAEFDFCGCGWPHHMLLPKGNTNGYPMVLFVMVSNWAEDGIKQDTVSTCKNAASYCGLRDRKYPDRRAMGYPFDRPVNPEIKTVTDFLKPNMAVINCNIRFTDSVKVSNSQ